MPTGVVPNFDSETVELSRKQEFAVYGAPFGRGDASFLSGSESMDFSDASGQEQSVPSSMTVTPYGTAHVKDLARSKWGERDTYQQVRQVGSGSYGSCVLLKRKSDSALRVCKVTERIQLHNGDGAYENEPLEAKILKDILPLHDRICRLHDSIVGPRTVQLYFDYYSGGDLSNIIRLYEWNWETIPEAFLWHAFIQLAEAIAFMHTGYSRQSQCPQPITWQPVYHGDIKPANIFLSPPNPNSMDPLCRTYPSLVLGDFGMSSLRPAAGYGTLKYQPPEMPAVSGPSDVWAAGCVMHSLAHYDAPVTSLPYGIPETQANLLEWLNYPESRIPKPLYGTYSLEIHDCVFETFEWHPRGRISSLSLLEKILKMYTDKVEPFIFDMLHPLIDCDFRGKMYDENGVTLKTGDVRSVDFKIVHESEHFDMDETP